MSITPTDIQLASPLSIKQYNFQNMQFDILNELLTSTVFNLFSQRPAESSIENKKRVKELEKLSKPEPSTKPQSANDSFLSGYSSGAENRDNRRIPPCQSVERWMSVESGRRLKESMQKLGLDNQMLRLRTELENYLEKLSLDELANEKKKVKTELKIYDNDFTVLFGRAPTRGEKQPFRPLYGYYKELKKHIDKKGGQNREEMEARIRNIKNQRKDLRERIEAYQARFQKEHNRKIKYVKDIQPIEAEYRKYKDLKVELLKLEEILR